MPEKYGIAEGSVLGPIIFKMCIFGMLTCLDIEGLWHKVANLANKMPENHGIAEGHVLGQIIFKICTVDTRHADLFGH